MTDQTGDSYSPPYDPQTLRAADAPGRVRSRFLFALAAAVVIYVFAQGIAIYDQLPDPVPVHFGISGRPDGWAPKTVPSVFGPLIVVAACLLLLTFATRLGPKWFNFPGKDRMLRLPPHHQDHVAAPLREATAWIGAAVTIQLSLMIRQGWLIALGRATHLSPLLILPLLLAFLIPVVIGILAACSRITTLEHNP